MRRARSAVVWLVIVLAIVAIAWKLVSRPDHAPAPVEPLVAISAHEPAPVVLRAAEPAETPLVVASAPIDDAPRAVPIVIPEQQGFASIHGYVLAAVDREGFGEEMHVSWTNRLGQRHTVQAAEDGAYSFAGMRPGRYWITTGSRQNGRAEVELDVEGDHRLDLQLELQPEVLVRIVDPSGTKVEGMHLLAVATVEAPGAWIDEIVGSFNNTFGVGEYFQGRWRQEELPSDVAGRIVLEVPPPVFVSLLNFQSVVATQRVELGQRDVTFVVDPADRRMQSGKLLFRLVSARTREPLEEGAVFVDGVGTRRRNVEPGARCEIKLSPGWCVVHVRAKGFGDPSLRLRIEPGVETDLGDVALEEAMTIAGRVVGPKGEPVTTDLEYDALAADGSVAPVSGTRYLKRCGNDGAFEIGGLAPVRYRLRATGPDTERWTGVVDVCSRSVQDLEIRLEPTVPLVVHFAEGAWENARLRVVDARGEVHAEQRVYRREPYPIRLVAGSYVVEYFASPTGTPRRIPVEIAGAPLELALP